MLVVFRFDRHGAPFSRRRIVNRQSPVQAIRTGQRTALKRPSNLNLPNVISAVRLALAPFAAVVAFRGSQPGYVAIVLACLLSDILDGWIARRFGLETDLGVLLDSAADELVFYSVIVGLLVLKRQEIGVHAFLIYIYIVLALIVDIVSLIRFHRISSVHLYSFKATGYIQGLTLAYIFFIGFNIYVYYFGLLFGILSCLEIIAVNLLLHEYRPNARGLYWVLREQREPPKTAR
jgi:CDP-diacylglycerol--glycerol-3-phosphate 3-phosphatidyltransferase